MNQIRRCISNVVSNGVSPEPQPKEPKQMRTKRLVMAKHARTRQMRESYVVDACADLDLLYLDSEERKRVATGFCENLGARAVRSVQYSKNQNIQNIQSIPCAASIYVSTRVFLSYKCCRATVRSPAPGVRMGDERELGCGLGVSQIDGLESSLSMSPSSTLKFQGHSRTLLCYQHAGLKDHQRSCAKQH